MAIMPYVSADPVDAISPVATSKKYSDPMEWLAKRILDLSKEEIGQGIKSLNSSHEKTKRSNIVPKSSQRNEADPLDWMLNLFSEIFKKGGEKKLVE